MRALLVEGGGVRAAFAAGVLDALLEDEESFDLVAGTSAGGLLAAAYLAGQRGRSLRVLRHPECRAAFGRISDFLRGGDLIDLELLHEAAERLEPLDVGTVMSNPARLLLTVTDVATGSGHLIEPSAEELVDALKATSALPIAVRSPVEIRGMPCLDGGITIPIPVQEVIRAWCHGTGGGPHPPDSVPEQRSFRPPRSTMVRSKTTDIGQGLTPAWGSLQRHGGPS
jgi:predicted patatin/cPLA2 family phospholipase